MEHLLSIEELSADQIAPFIGVLRQDQAFALDKLLLERKFAKAHVLLQDLLKVPPPLPPAQIL